MKLKDALKVKGAYIYYYDRGSWVVYDHKPKKSEEMDEADELASGSDHDGMGYESPLVVALAKLLGITVESI